MYVDTAARSNGGHEPLGQDEVADADPGRDGLRERGGVRHQLAALELVQQRRRVALVADEPVRVVLEHRQVVGARELDEPAPALRRQRAAARVLERRDRVEERGTAPGERRLERVEVEPVLVLRHRLDLDPQLGEERERPVVGRRLDEHPAGTLGEERARVEEEALERAVRERDP